MTSSCDSIIIIINPIPTVNFTRSHSVGNEALPTLHSREEKEKDVNVTARTHLGAFNRPERQRAEDTGTVERVESDRPLSIRLPLYGRKVVGCLERIDTLATAGEKRNDRRKKTNS